MEGDAVHDGSHRELAHAVVNIVASGISSNPLGAGPQRQVGAGQIGRPPIAREPGAQCVQGLLRALRDARPPQPPRSR